MKRILLLAAILAAAAAWLWQRRPATTYDLGYEIRWRGSDGATTFSWDDVETA